MLRLVGSVELLAFAAVVLPGDWMDAGHRSLGLEAMPPGPVFDSVMRQVSFTWGERAGERRASCPPSSPPA